jgi:WD40 repeat protein
VAFSPDGMLLASGGRGDSTVRLWHPATGEHLRTLAGHRGGWFTRGLTCAAVSPDGRLLAVGGAGKTVQLWDL